MSRNAKDMLEHHNAWMEALAMYGLEMGLKGELTLPSLISGAFDLAIAVATLDPEAAAALRAAFDDEILKEGGAAKVRTTAQEYLAVVVRGTKTPGDMFREAMGHDMGSGRVM